MSDINNIMVKQEVIKDEAKNQETYILPDTHIEIKQEDMELADGEEGSKQTDDKLQPSCSEAAVHVEKSDHVCKLCGLIF